MQALPDGAVILNEEGARAGVVGDVHLERCAQLGAQRQVWLHTALAQQLQGAMSKRVVAEGVADEVHFKPPVREELRHHGAVGTDEGALGAHVGTAVCWRIRGHQEHLARVDVAEAHDAKSVRHCRTKGQPIFAAALAVASAGLEPATLRM